MRVIKYVLLGPSFVFLGFSYIHVDLVEQADKGNTYRKAQGNFCKELLLRKEKIKVNKVYLLILGDRLK